MDDGELIWEHEQTGALLHVLVDQALPAWRVSDMFLRQDQIKTRLRTLSFWAIENAQGATVSPMASYFARPVFLSGQVPRGATPNNRFRSD